MNVAVMKTKAEQALSENFERVAPQLAGNSAVRAARASSIGRFGSLGLPHRRIEEWKYTDLRAAFKEAYPLAVPGNPVSAADVDGALGAELAALDCIRLVFVDGIFAETLSRFDGERDKTYFFDPLSKALAGTDGDWLGKRLADSTGAKAEAVVELNTAFVRDGATLRIERGARPARPVHLVFISASLAPAATFVRNMVGIGAGAGLVMIESHVALNGAPRQSNAVAEIALHEGASLQHIKIVDLGEAATHVGTATVEIDEGASYRSFELTKSTGLARNQSFITFAGENASIDLSGAFLVRGREHVDTTLVVDHAVPHCVSRELYKGVLADNARGVFQGKIIVRPDAQKTDGKQMSQALMLSPDAEFDSKPELEIFADDVVCGHGTTSAELDPDLLFYCLSRGIPEPEARALMIASFVGEAIDKVEHDALRAALMGLSDAWLKKHTASKASK